MATPFEIIGFGPTDFDPGFVGEVRFGQGGFSAAAGTLFVMLVGNMTSAGSMTPDVSIVACYDQTQANALAGTGSELARMYEWAAKAPNAFIFLCPVTESVGVAASMTVTFATTATSAGDFIYYIGGRRFVVSVAAGDTATVAGDSFVTEVNRHPEFGFTAANVTGTVTCTWRQKGTRGNDIIVRQDISSKPGAMTSTLGGGAALAEYGSNGRKFGGGTTADSVSAAATNSHPGWYHRIGLAHRDSTNLAAWETAMDTKAAWQEQHPQHTVVAFNGSLAAAQSLTQTTLNNARFCFLWGLNQEQDPAEIAAWFAAYRSVAEVSDPATDYDGLVIPGATPFFLPANNPGRSTRVAALRTGVTPIYLDGDKMTIRRAITTKCLDGTNADYRTLDVGTAYVPDFIRYDMGLTWLQWKQGNPVLMSDPAPEQGDRPEGVGTPTRWNQTWFARLKEHEQGLTTTSRLPVLTDVDLNPPQSILNTTPGAERIMTASPVVPAKRQHQLGSTISQL